MNWLYKNMRVPNIVAMLIYCSALQGSSVTITTPAASSTVTGFPLSITGTASPITDQVRITINTTVTAYVTPNGSGNWSASSPNIANGNYTVTADLLAPDGQTVLATASNSFTISNPPTITITTPNPGGNATATVVSNPVTVSGGSSLTSTTVNVSVDGTLAGTTTTDSFGNWTTTAPLTANGVHTLLAQLIVAASPVASSSIGITALIPIFLPPGKNQATFVQGLIPTTGSGSGSGFIYTVSGSSATVTFTPAFASLPSVLAIGVRASGSSTITLAAVSISAVTFSFTAGTTNIHFVATTTA